MGTIVQLCTFIGCGSDRCMLRETSGFTEKKIVYTYYPPFVEAMRSPVYWRRAG